MPFLFNIYLVFLCCISFVSVNSESCFQSDTTYTICSSNGTSINPLSKLFSAAELVKECHEHFIESHLGKSCKHHDHHHDHDHHHQHQHHTAPTTFQRYVYGFIAVFIVSALSLVGLLTLPVLYKVSFEYVLNLFTAIAIGTLFGDAMFHLFPTVFGLHNHNHNDHHDHSAFSVPNYQWKMLLAVFILYTFYLLEVFLHWFAHYKHDHNASHSHIHNPSNKPKEIYQYKCVDIDVDIEHTHLHHNHTHHNLHQHLNTPSIYSNAKSFFNHNSSPCTPCPYSNEPHVINNPFPEYDVKEKTSAEKSEQISIAGKLDLSQLSHQLDYINPIVQKLKTIKSTGWMVLFGDSIHNFADGLAISAAFSQDLLFGITTTIAVACHELPHELGDYAVLLQSGFSHTRALLWNFLSATTAIIGFFIGSYTSNSEQARQWIFAATIGMFLYIALVDLLPTLLADGHLNLKRFLVVNIGFIVGITIMFILALVEDKIITSSIK